MQLRVIRTFILFTFLLTRGVNADEGRLIWLLHNVHWLPFIDRERYLAADVPRGISARFFRCRDDIVWISPLFREDLPIVWWSGDKLAERSSSNVKMTVHVRIERVPRLSIFLTVTLKAHALSTERRLGRFHIHEHAKGRPHLCGWTSRIGR